LKRGGGIKSAGGEDEGESTLSFSAKDAATLEKKWGRCERGRIKKLPREGNKVGARAQFQEWETWGGR